MAPFSAAFGAMLLSLALWMQNGWGWSALETGMAIAPGPVLVPVTSLLLAKRMIARFGTAAVIAIGVFLFALGFVWWAAVPGLAPNTGAAFVGMVFLGIGVGLTFPTLMGAGTSSLPPSSFATGSGVLNMTRQTFLAIGVAFLVAVLGEPHSSLDRLMAFDRAWWIMAGLTMLSLVPLALLTTPKHASGPMSLMPITRPSAERRLISAGLDAVAPLPSAQAEAPSDEAAIRTLFERQIQAENAHDITGFAAVLAPNVAEHRNSVVLVSRAGSFSGHDAVVQRFEAYFKGTWKLDPDWTGISLIRLGKDAFHLIAPTQITLGAPGTKPQTLRFQINEIAIRTGEGWRFTTIIPVLLQSASER
jgi:MFS family permease